MKRRRTALLAGLVAAWSAVGPDLARPLQAGPGQALAQRAPLYGVWTGGMRCGRYVRIMQLFMYGNGTGLLLLGISPFTPDVKPAVAMVSLRQPPDNDYILIDRWISNPERPLPQLVGRLGADRTFDGQVMGDARCDQIFFRPYAYPDAVLQNMVRWPLEAAGREARKLNPPQVSAKEMIVLGIFAYVMLSGASGNGSSGGGGGGGGWSPPPSTGSNPPLPSVGGNVHGNRDTDIHGNGAIRDGHGNTLVPLPY